MELYNLTISEAHRLLQNREITSQHLTRTILDRIGALDEKIGAFLTVTADQALEQAEAADRIIASGKADLSPGFPSLSKTSFARKASVQPAARRSSTISFRLTMQRSWHGSSRRAR